MSGISLNFGSNANFTAVNTTSLKAWDIHNVTFEGAEYSVVQSKKEVDKSFELLKFNFKNDLGRYSETFFAPKAGDEIRKTRTNANGHLTESPSGVENMMTTLKHILGTLSSENLPKLLGRPFKSFKELSEILIKATNSSIGKEFKIKLIGDKEGKARSPFCVSVFSNGGEAVLSNNFICNNDGRLFFTDYEATQMKNITTSKPTNMANIKAEIVENNSSNETEDDLDFDLV